MPWSFLLRFLLVVGLVAGGAFYFTGFQLARAFDPGTPGRWGAWLWAGALWIFPFVRVIFFRDRVVSRWQGLAFFMLGLAATLFMGLLALRLVGWGLGLAGYAWPAWAPWVMLAVSVLFSLWGWQAALGAPEVRHMTLRISGLHPGLRGLRIVQISDLHVSHLVGAGQVAQLVEQVRDLKPDLIAVTGDLIDGPLADLRGAVQPLAGLQAPLGVHYVTGNHEYFWDVDGWLEEFQGLGFELLTNAHRALSHQGAKLVVMGVNDPTADRLARADGPNLGLAAAGAPRADFTLFLAHQPQAYTLAQAAGADLFLAGHTHGGQFFPFSTLIGLFHRYARGLYRHEGRLWVYVHTGSGFWGPPNRLGVPPEVALLELERN